MATNGPATCVPVVQVAPPSVEDEVPTSSWQVELLQLAFVKRMLQFGQERQVVINRFTLMGHRKLFPD